MSRQNWKWLWLYPATLVVHLLEERLGGARFYEWVERAPGAELTAGEFLGLTTFAVLGLTALTLTMLRWEGWRFLAVSVAVAFFLNSISHIVNSMIAGSYTSGLITGIIVWWPLTWFALRRCRQLLTPGAFRTGLLVGVAIQLGVMATTLMFTLL